MVTLHSLIYLLLSSFVLSSVVAFALDSTPEYDSVILHGPSLPVRSLRAAKRSDKLSRREVKGCLSNDHQLHYLDDHMSGRAFQFAARLTTDFKRPTLLLEDIEHTIDATTCLEDEIHLSFSSAVAFSHAQETFLEARSFLLVTSHEGCNKDGEREPYVVHGVTTNSETQSVILSTSRVHWKHTINSMTVDFGESKERLNPRRHGKLQPRQAETASTATSSAATSSFAYPPAPTSTATSVNVTEDIGHQYLDRAILPPDLSLGPLPLSVPVIPAGLAVKCKNCTFQGNINLVAGSFTMGPFNSTDDDSDIGDEAQAIFNYIQDGFVEFRANGLGAHIELDNTVEASAQLISFTVPLPAIPITPLLIPGIATVGPQFIPALTAGFQVTATLDFSTGFEVSVPDNSSLLLSLGDRTNSSQQGFADTTVIALPFQASTPDLSITFSAGFYPQLLLGISFFERLASAGAGFILNLPALTSTLSIIHNATDNCENATSSSPKARIYDTLTHIENKVDVGLGVIAQAELDFPGSGNLSDVAQYPVLGKTFDLPTGCIAFDTAKKTYGPVAAAATGGGQGKPGVNAASSLDISFNAGLGRLAMALAAVAAVFMLF